MSKRRRWSSASAILCETSLLCRGRTRTTPRARTATTTFRAWVRMIMIGTSRRTTCLGGRLARGRRPVLPVASHGGLGLVAALLNIGHGPPAAAFPSRAHGMTRVPAELALLDIAAPLKGCRRSPCLLPGTRRHIIPCFVVPTRPPVGSRGADTEPARVRSLPRATRSLFR